MGETGESSTPAKTGGKTMSGRDEHDEMKEPEWMVKKREYEQRMARAKNVKLRTLCTICGEKAKLPCPCGTAQYCTVACQKIDWRDRGHRKACKKIRDERAAEAARAEAPTPPPSPPRDVVYGPAPRSGADEVRARIAAEHEAARARREAEPEPEKVWLGSARSGRECPICFVPWDPNMSMILRPCCCRHICGSCEKKLTADDPCPLCRSPWPKTDAEHLAMLKKNVANEVPEAITALAVCYRDGDYGLVKSAKKAAKLYKRAVELGDVKAMTSLGVYYKNGRGVKMDEAKAKQLYRMAADRGDYIAQMNLGGLLLSEKNDDEAYRWFLLAAQQGFTAAELQVGIAHCNGWGVAKDYAEAKRWFLRAAAKGCERSKGYLEQMDCKKAIRQSRPAADQGDVQAQYNLGNYLKDHGKELEDRGEHEESIAAYEESVRYLTRAAAQNCGEAQHNLAIAYAEGRGVEQDLAATVRLWRMADAQGIEHSRYMLELYDNLDKLNGLEMRREIINEMASEIAETPGRCGFEVRIMRAMFPEPPSDVQLRFDIGARVECHMEDDWCVGTVVDLWYREQGMTPGFLAPYQVELDEHQSHGGFIMAPEDDDDYIRRQSRLRSNSI